MYTSHFQLITWHLLDMLALYMYSEGNEEPEYGFRIGAIVGNMPISQYQSHILKFRISDMLDAWWVLKLRSLSL